MSIKLVLEMEADNGTSADNSDVEAANTATEVEASTSELGEVDGEANDYTDGIETSIDAAEELGEVNDVLAAGVESGEGVSEETAKMAEIAVEAICAKVGISARGARIMPAMESFGSSNSRLSATRMAMETIKEQATRIWEAIKKACIHVWNVIKNFFAGLFKSRAMLEKHLKNLKERANSASGVPDKKSFSTCAKEFSVDGKASLKTIELVLADTAKLTMASMNISNMLKGVVNNMSSDKPAEINVKGCLKGLPEDSGWNGAKNGDDGWSYGNFVKGRAIVYTESKADSEGNQKITFGIAEIEKNFAKEIDAPNKQDIIKIVDSAITILADLREFDKISKEIEQINKAIVSFVDKVSKTSEKLQENLGSKVSNEKSKLQESIRSMNTILSKIGTSIPNMIFAGCKAAADYANAGLNNLKTEKK